MAYDRQSYRAQRRDGIGTRNAYLYARSVSELSPDVDPSGWTFTRDGFTLTVSVQPDDYCDDWRGTFTDTYVTGAILTDAYRHEPSESRAWAQRGEYRYFAPAIPAGEYRQGYQRAGCARHVADCAARAAVERDYRDALERSDYIVTVTATREGIDLGSASLGGVDLGSDWTSAAVYVAGVVDELTGEAIANARDALARLGAAA